MKQHVLVFKLFLQFGIANTVLARLLCGFFSTVFYRLDLKPSPVCLIIVPLYMGGRNTNVVSRYVFEKRGKLVMSTLCRLTHVV